MSYDLSIPWLNRIIIITTPILCLQTGLTPLMEAASGGYAEVGRVLLDKGADVNAPPVPSSRDTALTIAADKGHYKFCELLINRSVPSNHPASVMFFHGHVVRLVCLNSFRPLNFAGARTSTCATRKGTRPYGWRPTVGTSTWCSSWCTPTLTWTRPTTAKSPHSWRLSARCPH